MSHYTVMVINTDGIDDIDEQLSPYDENLEVEKYSRGIVDEKDLQRFRSYYNPDGEEISDKELYDKHGIDWNGGDWEYQDNGTFEEFSTYNPDSKWDWYAVGGRWCGFLKVREGADVPDINPSREWTDDAESAAALAEKTKEAVADQAYNKNILWDKMIAESGQTAYKRWEAVANVLGTDSNGRINQPKLSWQQCIDRNNNNVDLARVEYNSQPIIEKWSKLEGEVVGYFSPISEYACTAFEYVNINKYNGISTYAVLIDGKWIAPGNMGWWGMSSESEDERDNWTLTFYDRFIKPLSPDALITIVDCHI
jgi:hypothetical protein